MRKEERIPGNFLLQIGRHKKTETTSDKDDREVEPSKSSSPVKTRKEIRIECPEITKEQLLELSKEQLQDLLNVGKKLLAETQTKNNMAFQILELPKDDDLSATSTLSVSVGSVGSRYNSNSSSCCSSDDDDDDEVSTTSTNSDESSPDRLPLETELVPLLPKGSRDTFFVAKDSKTNVGRKIVWLLIGSSVMAIANARTELDEQYAKLFLSLLVAVILSAAFAAV